MAKVHRIAVIPGDGIGREVMPEGVRVMEAAGAKHGISFQWKEFDWSCDWYKAHGKMCPDDAPQILRGTLEQELVDENRFKVTFQEFDWRLNDLTGGRID